MCSCDAERIVLGDQLIPEASSFNYLGMVISHELILADHVNYKLRKSWKALHFITRTLKKGNNNRKRLVYTAIVRPILQHGAVC